MSRKLNEQDIEIMKDLFEEIFNGLGIHKGSSESLDYFRGELIKIRSVSNEWPERICREFDRCVAALEEYERSRKRKCPRASSSSGTVAKRRTAHF